MGGEHARRLRYRWALDDAAEANISRTTSVLREPRRAPRFRARRRRK